MREYLFEEKRERGVKRVAGSSEGVTSWAYLREPGKQEMMGRTLRGSNDVPQ